jgi:hypothetical protein
MAQPTRSASDRFLAHRSRSSAARSEGARPMQKFGVSEGPIASAWKMLILKSTGERF